MNSDTLARYGLRPKRPEVFDSSSLKDFVDCPSLFYLRHILGLKRVYRDPAEDAKMDYGTVWHRMQERWHTTGNIVEAVAAVEPWPTSIMAETDKNGKSKQRIVKSMFEYAEKFKDDKYEFEDLRSEQYFDIYDEECNLRWCGILDRIRRRLRNKKTILWDFKTTSAMGDNYFDMHEFSFQLPGYVWAAQHMGDDSITEITLDVMYTLKTKLEFYRRSFRYEAPRLNEWRDNVKLIVERLNYLLDNHLYDPEAWHKNWNQCTRYGRCQFADVHFNIPSGDSRLLILQNDYVEDRWEPSERVDKT